MAPREAIPVINPDKVLFQAEMAQFLDLTHFEQGFILKVLLPPEESPTRANAGSGTQVTSSEPRRSSS